MNRAQRCELHNLALFRWVGGSACRVLLWPFWSRATLRATCQRPPAHPALYRQRVHLTGCDRKRFSSAALYKKRRKILSSGAGGAGLHCRDCGFQTYFCNRLQYLCLFDILVENNTKKTWSRNDVGSPKSTSFISIFHIESMFCLFPSSFYIIHIHRPE